MTVSLRNLPARAAALWLALILGTLAPAVSPAQPAPENLDLTEGGEAYLRLARRSGIEAQVGYFDPTRPPPELKPVIEFKPPEEREQSEVDLGDGQTVTLLITLMILGVIAYLVYAHGGATGLSFRSAPDQGARRGDAKDAILAGLDAPDVSGLANIAAIEDRRLALLALLRQVFSRAAEDNDLRLQRSWTAREALRRIPADWPHLAALGALVRDVELTHFGGRPVAEDAFQAHIALARPVLREGRS